MIVVVFSMYLVAIVAWELFMLARNSGISHKKKYSPNRMVKEEAHKHT